MRTLTEAPDLIVEAATLCERIWMASLDTSEFNERRCDRILKRAEARLQRREFAELDASQCSGFGCVDGCQDCRGCPECFTAHDIQDCPAIRALLFAEPDIAAIVARMDAEPYRCLGCDSATTLDTPDPGYCAACCKEMGNPARLFINPSIARTA